MIEKADYYRSILDSQIGFATDEGIALGELNKALTIAKKLLGFNLPMDKIIEATGLSREAIAGLQA